MNKHWRSSRCSTEERKKETSKKFKKRQAFFSSCTEINTPMWGIDHRSRFSLRATVTPRRIVFSFRAINVDCLNLIEWAERKHNSHRHCYLPLYFSFLSFFGVFTFWKEAIADCDLGLCLNGSRRVQGHDISLVFESLGE